MERRHARRGLAAEPGAPGSMRLRSEREDPAEPGSQGARRRGLGITGIQPPTSDQGQHFLRPAERRMDAGPAIARKHATRS
jgi:hypothetical protein